VSQESTLVLSREGKTIRDERVVRGRILVVDDSPTICKLVSLTLEKHGYPVIAAASGLEALAKLNDGLPSLILLDITMPGMDGYQLCKIIKGNQETASIPVVMLTGKDGFFDKVKGRMAGSSDYITKPFAPETLLRAVERHSIRPSD
jgi:twitching motility two-component system response regulator PilG